MKRKMTKYLIPALIMLLPAVNGCYSPAYYPYDTGYLETAPYPGGYPNQGYGTYEQNDFVDQGYYNQNDSGLAQDGTYDEDDNDDRKGIYDPARSWRGGPYGGY